MAEETERYLVLRADSIGVGGVMNILTTINSISVYGLTMIKYPYTEKFGHDHSLVILELKNKSNYDSARWLLIEVAKRMTSINPTIGYLPKPYKSFQYHGTMLQDGTIQDKAIFEIVDDPSLVLHYMGMIQERIVIQKEEINRKKVPEYLEHYE